MASALLAVAATLAYGGLTRVLAARAQLEAERTYLADAQAFFLLVTRDVEAALPRSVRDALGDREPAFAVAAGELRLTRGGSADLTDPPRSALRRLRYVQAPDGVHRALWPVLDAVQASRPADAVVLAGGTRLRFRCLGADGTWQTAWPPGRAGDALPRALEIAVDVPGLGRITRVLALAP